MVHEDKLDLIYDKVGDMEITLAEQHLVLKEHIRRTELLETQTEELRKFMYRAEGSFKILVTALTMIEIISKFWR